MSILTELQNSDIGASITALVGGSWTAQLGDGASAETATLDSEAKAYDWLELKALELHPESRFARIHKGAVMPRQPDQPGAEGIATARADEDTFD